MSSAFRPELVSLKHRSSFRGLDTVQASSTAFNGSISSHHHRSSIRRLFYTSAAFVLDPLFPYSISLFYSTIKIVFSFQQEDNNVPPTRPYKERSGSRYTWRTIIGFLMISIVKV